MKDIFTQIDLIFERFLKNNKNNMNIYIKNNYLYLN